MPNDELNTAKTNETEVIPQESGNADTTLNTEKSNEVQFTDTSNEGQNPTQKEEPKQNTKEQNSENARRRREAERQRELQKARESAIIETLGGKNPYTNEEMKDSTDVQEYLTMKEIEKNGGDPLADFSKFHKAKEKERIAEETKRTQEAEWFTKDREDFVAKHPEVNIDVLIANKQFQLYANGKVGKMPMTEIYEGFAEVVAEYEKKSKEMVKQTLANAKASPGALSSPNATDNGFFTREQVQKMTEKEVHENYDKIRASMRKWK